VSDDSISYRHRPKATSGEIGFRIEGDALAVETQRQRLRLPLGEAAVIRLTFELGALGRSIFRLTLRLRDGRKASLTNVTWHGIGETARQDEAYRTFVRALIATAVQLSPACRLLAGKSRPVWLAMVAVVVVTLLGLMAFAARALAFDALGAAVVGVVVFALTAFQVTPLILRNRPRIFAAETIPSDLLPR
jgi:hypothetical protein